MSKRIGFVGMDMHVQTITGRSGRPPPGSCSAHVASEEPRSRLWRAASSTSALP
jgi:hypothetical protein